MAEFDYKPNIKKYADELAKMAKGKAWNDDEIVLVYFTALKNSVYAQVHEVLAPQKTESAEKEIRDILSKYVIGYVDKKRKLSYMGAIDPIDAKILSLEKKRDKKEQLAKYTELKNDFMALASFRSLKHFALFMQPAFNFTLWQDTMDCFEGYWYYAGRMILDGVVKFIEAQCPTGYGKSMKDNFTISYAFGVDINNDVLKICGNDSFTDDCFQNTIKIMTHPNYAKVFPYYEQFHCKEDEMFSICSRKDLKFGIKGSTKTTNLRIATKKTNTSGSRARFLFIDDITQRRDMSNLKAHEEDVHAFEHEWFERNYNRNYFGIVASGTTYSKFDILSALKIKMGGENTKRSPINKHTSIGTSNYVVQNGTSVFVCVPLLDYDTDESTYPKKISTLSARKKREENPREFYAMDQQNPLPPENSPFYFTNLRQYTALPSIGECGRGYDCIASLDTKRRGKDYLSMPIFFQAKDPDKKEEDAYYLLDWLYDNRTMKECIPLIVSKIIDRGITRLYVERNTEECIEMILREKLAERGYTSCVIDEVYSTEPKDRRIMSAEGDIKSRMIFPQYGMYAQSNPIGKAMLNVYGYTYTGKVEHDDAIDSLALFAKRFIMSQVANYAELNLFKR